MQSMIEGLKGLDDIAELGGAGYDYLAKSLKNLTAEEIVAKTAAMGLSEAHQVQCVNTFAVDAANYQTAKSMGTLTASTTAASGATSGFKLALKGLWASLKPFLGLGAVIAVVTGIAWAIDKAVVTAEEQLEINEELRASYDDVSGELETVSSRMEEIKVRMEELNTAGPLSITDEQELERLKQENKELEYRKTLLEGDQEDAAIELTQGIDNWFEKEFRKGSYKRGVVNPNGEGFIDQETGSIYERGYLTREEEFKFRIDRAKELIALGEDRTLQEEEELRLIQEVTRATADELATKIEGYEAVTENQKANKNLWESYIADAAYVNDPAKYQKERFDEAWNSNSIGGYTSQIEELAKTRRVTSEDIKSYDAIIEKLNEVGVSAEVAAQEINAMFAGYSVDSTKDFLESFQSLSTNSIESILGKLKAGELTEDDLSGYRELQLILEATGTTAESAFEQLEKFAETYEFTSDLTASIQESYSALKEIKDEFEETGKVSIDSLTSISEQFPEIKTLTTQYAQGWISASELIEGLEQAYWADADAYRACMVSKLQTDAGFYNTVASNNVQLITELAAAYMNDGENWASLAEAKADIDEKLISRLSEGWSDYFGYIIDANTGMMHLTATMAPEDESADYLEAYAALNEMVEARNRLTEAAKFEITLPDFKGLGDTSDGSGSGDSSANDYNETFDFFERRVEVLQNAFDGLSASMENVLGANAKNTILGAQTGILAEEVKNYSDALAMYTEMGNRALSGLDISLQEKIKNGAVELTDFTGENGEAVVAAMEAYVGWAEKIHNCSVEIENLKNELAQLELAKFNNIAEQYSNKFDLYGNATDLIDKQIGLFEEAGQLVGEAFYEGQIDIANNQLDTLYAKKADLANQLASALASGYVKEGSKEWLEMVNTLSDLDGQIIEAKTSVEQFENAILQLNWDTFERIQTRFSDLNTELEGMLSLLSDFNDINVSDGEGTWTDEAIATLGIYAQQYEAAKYQVQQYSDAISDLKKDYLDGKYSATEYADKLAELNNGQWEAVKSTQAAEDAIISLNEARVNEEIEVINEAIEAYKEYTDSQIEALEAAKDLHDYENTIAEKTKSVTDLEKRLAAMQNDNSAATIAKRKQLEEELAEAKKDLEETEYDHSVETQIDALNKNYENFEDERNAEIEALQESLKNHELLISQSFETVKQNADLVGQQISQLAADHGVKISNSLTTSWKAGENAIASYGEVLTTGSSAFILQLSNVEQKEWDLQEQANSTSESISNLFTHKSEELVLEFDSATSSAIEFNDAITAIQQNLYELLDGGFDISGIASQLEEIESAAKSTSKAISSVSNNDVLDSSKPSVEEKKTPVSKYTYEIVDAGTGMVLDSYDNLETAKANRLATYGDFNDFTYIQRRDEDDNIRVLKFAKGGIVDSKDKSALDLIAQRVGEDRMIAVKDGEGILTPEQTNAFLKLAPTLSGIKPSWFRSPEFMVDAINQRPNVNYQYGSLVTVNGNVDDTNIAKMTDVIRKELKNTFAKIDRDHRYSGY